MQSRGKYMRFRGSPLLAPGPSLVDSMLEQARQQSPGQLCCQKLGPSFRHWHSVRHSMVHSCCCPSGWCRSHPLGSLQGCRLSIKSSSILTRLHQTTMFKRRIPPYWQACSTQVGGSTHNVVPLWQIGQLEAAAHRFHWWCLSAGQQQKRAAAASGSQGDQLPAWESCMPPSRPAPPRAMMAPEAQQAASIGVLFVQVWPGANAILLASNLQVYSLPCCRR